MWFQTVYLVSLRAVTLMDQGPTLVISLNPNFNKALSPDAITRRVGYTCGTLWEVAYKPFASEMLWRIPFTRGMESIQKTVHAGSGIASRSSSKPAQIKAGDFWICTFFFFFFDGS